MSEGAISVADYIAAIKALPVPQMTKWLPRAGEFCDTEVQAAEPQRERLAASLSARSTAE